MFATAVCYLPTNEPLIFHEDSFHVWNLSTEEEADDLLNWANNKKFGLSYSVRVFYH